MDNEAKNTATGLGKPSHSSAVPVNSRRYTNVTVWDASGESIVASGQLTRKFKNGVRIHGCFTGGGVDQPPSMLTYLDGDFLFTWE